MLHEIWEETKRRFRPVIPKRGGVNEQLKRIQLVTGGIMDFWSLDEPDGARGRKYKRAIVDEAAKVKQLQYAWQEVILATLADYSGDAWFLSTPKGLNYFYDLYKLGIDPNEPDWQAWQLPTAVNPYINPDEIERFKRILPERVFAQEFLAVFLENTGAVFRNVDDAATAEPQDSAVDGHEYVMGADFGKLNDFSVFTVLDITQTPPAQVYLDRMNQVDYILQVQRLKDIADRFNPVVIRAEKNSIGVPVLEMLERLELPVQAFQTTNASKTAAIEGLALAIERGDIRILADEVQKYELLSYEARRTASGAFVYGPADSSQHDDTVMALAIARSAIEDTGPLLLW